MPPPLPIFLLDFPAAPLRISGAGQMNTPQRGHIPTDLPCMELICACLWNGQLYSPAASRKVAGQPGTKLNSFFSVTPGSIPVLQVSSSP